MSRWLKVWHQKCLFHPEVGGVYSFSSGREYFIPCESYEDIYEKSKVYSLLGQALYFDDVCVVKVKGYKWDMYFENVYVSEIELASKEQFLKYVEICKKYGKFVIDAVPISILMIMEEEVKI